MILLEPVLYHTEETDMAATFLVFYKYKSMTKEEAQKAVQQWRELRNGLPGDVELIGEYNHAWGTEYNGFLLFEAEIADSFLDWWSSFKDSIRWYVEKTYTITARKR
jgi:hypothetical protein